jgi:S1-C subfamily serine protease
VTDVQILLGWVRRACSFLSVLFCCAQPAFAQHDWPKVVEKAAQSIPRLEAKAEDGDQAGVCAAVIFTVGYAVTAAHCTEGKNVALTLNGKHAEVSRANRVLDLAVIRYTAKGESALPLASESPVMGQEISVLGYPFGSRQLGTQVGRVATVLDDEGKSMLVGVDVIAGDSGGACINANGELVGITVAVRHWGPMHLGIVVPLDAVRDFINPYLPKVTK